MISFIIRGTPQPQGSVRAFMPKGWKRPVLTTDNPKLKAWRATAQHEAQVAMNEIGAQLTPRPLAVRVEARFYFVRPKSGPKDSRHKTTRPDLDKCSRALLDSLTGICIEDDSQVTQLWVSKFYGATAYTEVRVTDLRDLMP